jgi:autotransporter translocation and assembly factor TamB
LRQKLNRFLKTLFKAMTLALFLPLLAWAAFQSPLNGPILSYIYNQWVAEPEEKIIIAPLMGLLPFHASCPKISIYNQDRLFLTVTNLNWRINFSELLKGKITLQNIQADKVFIDSNPTRTAFNPVKIPSLKLLGINIEKSQIKLLEIINPKQDSLALTLEASFFNDQNIELNAHVLISQPENIPKPLTGLFDVAMNTTHNTFKMKAHLEDTEAYLSRWAGSKIQIPCHLNLDGQGDLSSWSGHINGKIPGIEDLESDIKLQTLPDHSLKINLDGTIKLISVNDPINFNLNAHKSFEKLDLEATSHIHMKDNSLELKAHVHDGKLFQLNGKWRILSQDQLNDFLSLSPDIEFPTGDLCCDIDTKEQSLALSFNMPYITLRQQRLDDLDLEISASYKTPQQPYQWHLKSSAIDTQHESPLSLISSGLLNQDLRSGTLHHIHAEGYGSTLFMDGQLSLSSQLNGTINLLLSHSNGASIRSNITCKKTPDDSSSSITFDPIWVTSPGLPHPLTHFAQAPAHFSFNMQLNNPLQWRKLNFSHPILSLYGDSKIDLNLNSLEGQLSFQSKLDLFQPELKGTFSGALDISGSLSSPQVQGQFACHDCAIGKKFDANEITGEFSGEIFKSMNISAQALKNEHALGLITCMHYNHDQLTFQNTEIQSDNNWIRSKSISYPFDDQKPLGTLTLHIPNLNAMTEFGGYPLSGAAFGEIKFMTKGPLKTHHTLINMNLIDFENDNIASSSVDMDLDVITQPSGIQFSGEAKMENILTPHMTIRQMTLTAQPLTEPQGTNLSILLLGDVAFPFEIIGQSTVECLLGQKLSLVLDHLSGHINNHTIALLKPAQFTQTPNAFVGSGHLSIGEGTLLADATFSDATHSQLLLENLPASILLDSMCVGQVNGTIDGSFKLQTKGESPQFSLSLKGHDLSAVGFEKNTIDLVLEINNLKEEIHANGSIHTNKTHALTFRMLSPAHFSFANLLAITPENIQIECDGDIELTPLSDMLTSEEHTVTGLLNIHSNLTFGKNISLKGSAFINNGTYENVELGTTLKNFKAAISFSGKKTTLDLVGLDSGDGKFKISGDIDFSKNTPIFNLNSHMMGFHGVQMDDLHASLNGSLSLENNPTSLKPILAGNLKITPFHYNIPDSTNRDLTPLESQDIEAHLTLQNHTPSVGPIDLDIELMFPDSIILTGRGLESLWDGQMRLKGSILSPILEGHFQLKNGRFNFAGKTLPLTHGHIRFDNRPDNDPQIDVTAKVQTPELLAIFELAQRASAPSFSVRSDPVNQKDEIISQVLFGKSPGQINFSQSLQLASAIQSLRTPGKGLTGIMDTVRSTMGLDSISLKETYDLEQNDTKTAISVGKYISEKVYVSIGQDVSGGNQGSQATIEIALTPQTSVETDVGKNFGGGFTWRWRY